MALRVMLTGGRLDAQEASGAGLLARPPVAPESLQDEVADLVEQLSAATPSATRAVLSAIRDTSTPSSLGLSHEAATAAIAISSEAGQSGIASFLSRGRKPS
jgi:enoyl-CoA hydratase/carnithine racemase